MSLTSRSITPSIVTLPETGEFEAIFQFLLFRFPRIPESVWRERVENKKVHFDTGEPIDLTTSYQAYRRICYYREVANEPKVPFEEEILFENDDFLVVDKPHFLPVHPAGKYVNETLITRLRKKTGYEELGGAHRIDRLTAGLVLCVKTRAKRGLYQQMFMRGEAKKMYLAAGNLPPESDQARWHVKARMEPYDDYFRMHIVPGGPVNSESVIELLDRREGVGLFRLQPVTGKKHQLRVHLCAIGSRILNDPLYPECPEEEVVDEIDRPMQLLAHRLEFTDPVTGAPMIFQSRRVLDSFLEMGTTGDAGPLE